MSQNKAVFAMAGSWEQRKARTTKIWSLGK